ncbi:MAG: hypothetical protein ACO3JL_00870 [Myxococcota bacterium]
MCATPRILGLLAYLLLLTGTGLRAQPVPDAIVKVEHAQQEVVQGTVDKVDYGRGYLVISSGEHILRLRARGGDLARFAPGQHVTLRYEIIGEIPWLEPSMPETGAPSYPPAGRVGYTFGLVRRVDRSQGEIVVVGPTPHEPEVTAIAHPRQLVGIVPGHMVAARYVYLGVGLPSVIELSSAPLSAIEDLVPSGRAANPIEKSGK